MHLTYSAGSAHDPSGEGGRIIRALILMIVFIALDLAMHVYDMLSRKAKPLDPTLVQLAVVQSLDRTKEQAGDLIRAGQHLKAALLLADIAATQRTLLPKLPGSSHVEPDIYELSALHQCQLAGVEPVYAEFLKLRYPSWVPPYQGPWSPSPVDSGQAD